MSKVDPIQSWAEFKKQMHTCFGNLYEDTAGEFTKLKQTTSIKENLW